MSRWTVTLLCLLPVVQLVSSVEAAQPPQLDPTNATFRVGPTAGGQPAIPKTPNNVIYAYPGEPGKFFIANIGVFASKNTPLTPNQALLIQGFDIALSVQKGTGSPPDLVNWAAGTPSVEGDPECPGNTALPCLIRDVGFSNIDLYDNPSPDNPVWKTGTLPNGPFEAGVEAAFRIDYSVPPTPSTAAGAEVEIATFHYGIPHTAAVGNTYNIVLPASPNGINATNSQQFTRTIVNSLKIGGNDYAPDDLQNGVLRIVKRPSIVLNSAALKNIDGTRVCVKWTVDPVPTNNCQDPESAPFDHCYGVHLFRDGQDIGKYGVTEKEAEVDAFDFCDFTEVSVFKVAIRMKEDPSCICPACDNEPCKCCGDCSNCSGQIVFSNELAVSRIPHHLEDLCPDNWPYFMPLTELTVKTKYAFNQDCGRPAPGYDGPYTTTATACTGVNPVITAPCTNAFDLCCNYGTGNTMGSSLWKIEVSCIDTDPFVNGNQSYQFIYDGRNGRADTLVLDPYTVEIYYPGPGKGPASAYASLPAVTPLSAADPKKPRQIPSVYRVSLVVVNAQGNVVARSQSMPINFGFRRGDSNRNTAVTLSDVVNMLNFWGTQGGSAIAELDCACDANASGTFTLADVVYLINHVAFSPGGPPPPDPYICVNKRPAFGVDDGERPPADLIITNEVLLRCYHYCPCFNQETRGKGSDTAVLPGDAFTRTEIGCCVCRCHHYREDDKTAESCDLYKCCSNCMCDREPCGGCGI